MKTHETKALRVTREYFEKYRNPSVVGDKYEADLFLSYLWLRGMKVILIEEDPQKELPL